MGFLGRRSEMEFLEKEYRSSRGSFVPIYGRRRVGKTQLIAKFMEDKPGIYYVGERLPVKTQREEFLRVAGEALGDPTMRLMRVDSWRQAMEVIAAKLPKDRKFIIALDEFQWMVEHREDDLPGTLQEFWDRWWQQGGVFLILCGSFIGFMEREILGRKAPLFGRRTGQIQLRPFPFHEAAAFHPTYSLVDQARTYFICGGIPLYLAAFDEKTSVEGNIEEKFLGEHTPLFREVEFLLREELRELENYYAILMWLGAERRCSARELGERTGLGASVHYYLEQLVELGYVGRKYPLMGKKPDKRAVRFALDDPLLRFWFRFVHPNRSFLRPGGAHDVLQERIRPELDGYFGACFERLCREALPLLYLDEGVRARHEVGEFWSRDCQIDVVGMREDGWTDLGECKWGKVRSPKSVLAEIETKVKHFPNVRGATIGRRIFTRSRLKGLPDTVRANALEDLYAAARRAR